MDFNQLKKDSKSLLSENQRGIRKEMWNVLSIYWLYIIAYSLITYFSLSKDISKAQSTYYIVSYLLGFITRPAGFIFSVCFFRALYLYFPNDSIPGVKVLETLKNPRIIFRCIVLGFLQHILEIPSTLTKLIPLIRPDGDSTSKMLGSLLMVQLAVIVISVILFSIFLPCLIAQGLTILNSLRSAIRLILDFMDFIRFSLRVLLPAEIIVFSVLLLCMMPLFYFQDYLDKLYFMVIFGALSPMFANSITYGLWMKMPYINLCIMEYVDINQCMLQTPEDVVEEYSDEDFEIRAERLKKLQQIRGNMHHFSVAVGKSIGICLKNDGSVLAFDLIKKRGFSLEKWKDIWAVAAGADRIFGIRNDGIVVLTDVNHIDTITELKDEIDDNVSLLNDIVEIGAGEEHIVALKRNGEVVAAGDNKYDQCEAKKMKDITKIAVGSWHTVGLKKDGTVVAEGLNEDGQCNVSKWVDIYSIAAGDWHTIGLKTGGSVIAAGFNKNGQCNVAKWADVAAVVCGKKHSVGLLIDGTVVATGDNSVGQCNVSGWSDIVAISAGDDCTAGLKSDGTVVFTKINGLDNTEFPNWTDIRISK